MAETPIKFFLRKITTEQFAVIGKPPKINQKLRFNTQSKFACNFDERSIGTFFIFELVDANKPILIIEIGCHFGFEQQSWKKLINDEDESITLPKEFASHLLMITVGTTRGVLHNKLENTSFNNFYIPLINVMDIIRSDMYIKSSVESITE